MALVIETGSGVPGANSYASVAEARAYATARGLSLPADDTAVERALVLACDKLETYAYKGDKADESNPLEWPRQNVYVGAATEPLDNDAIPDRLKTAQCQLAYDSTKVELQPTGTGREVIATKVDAIETRYAQRNSGSIRPELNKAEDILKPLLSTSGGFGLSVVRV